MLDLFWFQRLDAGNFREWVHQIGFEEIREESRRRGVGVSFMCVHQGNWEWANLAAGFIDFKNITVVENFKNPLLTRIFGALREHAGATIVSQETAILRMNRALKAGASTGMLIDLTMRPGRLATVLDTFGTVGANGQQEGLKICAPIIHALLAERTGSLLVVVETEPHEDGRVTVTAHPPVVYEPDATQQEVAQLCWDAFEPILRRRPWEYLWMYKHFRYRPKVTSRDYPSYSNTSASFEKMRSETPVT
jgi:lauroyl/myristoyl acyltransferase